MGIIFLLLCLALFIIQIILLVKSVKKNEKKYWISNSCLEIFSIILSLALLYYYDNIAPRGGFMPGLEYLGEELFQMGILILYFVMLFITAVAGIIVFEKSRKSKGKKSANPLILIMALLFISIGIISLFIEIKDNLGKVKTDGVVIGFEKNGIENVEYWPVIQFSVDGKEYQDDYPMNDTKIGDTVQIYYSVYDNYHISRHLTNNKIIWIPAFIIGIFIIFLRFKIINKRNQPDV